MIYKPVWHEKAVADLKSLDREIARKIVERVKSHLVQHPDKFGKPLKGVLKGLCRYRYSDYRIIYSTDKAAGRISILHVAHRSEAYRMKD